MKTIYKYAVSITDEFELRMPWDAQVLTVQEQHDQPQLWALVDTTQPTETRRFSLRSTGHPADNVGAYVGTFQVRGGSLVFHLFEAPKPNGGK